MGLTMTDNTDSDVAPFEEYIGSTLQEALDAYASDDRDKTFYIKFLGREPDIKGHYQRRKEDNLIIYEFVKE